MKIMSALHRSAIMESQFLQVIRLYKRYVKIQLYFDPHDLRIFKCISNVLSNSELINEKCTK